METEKILMCLNPTCTNSRCFQYQMSKIHKQCQGWIIDPCCLQRQEYINKTIINNKLSFNLDTFQLATVFDILRLRDWPQQMSQIFDSIKNSICQDIDNIKSIKIREFQQILTSAKKMYVNICKNVRAIEESQSSGQILFPEFVNQFKTQKSLNINFLHKAEVYFKRMVCPPLLKTFDFIQSTNISQHQVLERFQAEAIKKTKFQFEQNISVLPNQKLQKISSILDQKIVKPKYDSQFCLYKTNCWFCDETILSSEKQSSKQSCIVQFLRHLKQKHQKVIFNAYQHRVLKSDVLEINLNTLIQKIQSQQFQQIIVVDRQNAGMVEKPFDLQKSTLWIEVMNKSNRNLAKGQFILADSNKRDAADTMMSILVYEISKSCNSQIILVTKDHFGETLKQIINSIFKNKMSVVEPKYLQKTVQQ